MFDIEKAVREVLDLKRGNQEIALFFDSSDGDGQMSWELLVGNPTNCVRLGEVSGEFETEGYTIEEVFTKMKEVLNDAKRK